MNKWALVAGIVAAFVGCIAVLDYRVQRKKSRHPPYHDNRRDTTTAYAKEAKNDAIARAIKDLQTEYTAQSQQHERTQKTVRNIGVLTLLAIGVYTLLTYCLLQTTRESFTAAQRAFVYADNFRLVSYRDKADALQYWRAALYLGNSGSTPTRGMKWVVQRMYGPPISPETNEVDISSAAESEGFLGPKASFPFFDMIINRTAEERIMKGEPLFILGKVTYFDTVTPSTIANMHTTKFCFQLYGPPYRADLPVPAVDTLITQ
jgi:hypothetical protein